MGNRKAALLQSDLTRYAKGLLKAGVSEFRVIVRLDGSHEIVTGKANAALTGPDPDELLKTQ